MDFAINWKYAMPRRAAVVFVWFGKIKDDHVMRLANGIIKCFPQLIANEINASGDFILNPKKIHIVLFLISLLLLLNLKK